MLDACPRVHMHTRAHTHALLMCSIPMNFKFSNFPARRADSY